MTDQSERRGLIPSKSYLFNYRTPKGFADLVMRSDGEALTGLWFKGSPGAGKHTQEGLAKELPVFRETSAWLDGYFAGQPPAKPPHLRIEGLTAFRRDVIAELRGIPYGETRSYGEIAARLARRKGRAHMSAQAVGGAVGWNPICILVPCHRVIGQDGSMVGYGGGLANKIALLRHERRHAEAPPAS